MTGVAIDTLMISISARPARAYHITTARKIAINARLNRVGATLKCDQLGFHLTSMPCRGRRSSIKPSRRRVFALLATLIKWPLSSQWQIYRLAVHDDALGGCNVPVKGVGVRITKGALRTEICQCRVDFWEVCIWEVYRKRSHSLVFIELCHLTTSLQ